MILTNKPCLSYSIIRGFTQNLPASPFLENYPVKALDFSQTWKNINNWILS